MKELAILYIGYLLNEDLYKNNPATNISGGIFEEGLLFELKKQLEENSLTVLTIVPNDYYPHGCFRSRETTGKTKRGIDYSTIPYVNLPLLKQQSLFHRLKKKIRRWIRETQYRKKVIVTYNLGTPIVQAVCSFESKIDGFFPIVCDYFHHQKKEFFLKSFFHKITSSSQEKYLKKSKGAIILNQCLADDYGLKSYLIMEGAVSDSNLKVEPSYRPIGNFISIRYAGTLDELHGTKVLLDLGKLLKKQPIDCELLIVGRGNLMQDIIDASNSKESSIRYLGVLPREEANSFIRDADILLIPHQSFFYQLRYQFSSKMFDYLVAKKPVIITPMPGFPDDYKSMTFVAKNDGAESILEQINIIKDFNKQELCKKLNLSRNFVLSNRTWNKQAARLIEYINKSIE